MQNENQNHNLQILKTEVASNINKPNVADKIIDSFRDLANRGELYLPADYPVGNALKLAYTKIISDRTLASCTPTSIANSLATYAIQGLNVSYNQAYFINYGGELQMQRSYFGDIALTKRSGLVKDVYAIVIYQDDEIEVGFDYSGRETLVSHKTKFENRDKEIVGVYSVAEMPDGTKRYCFMTRKELETSWNMSKSRSNSKMLLNFKQEAAKRTAIRRLVKMIFNTEPSTTDEQAIIINHFNSTEDEYEDSEETKFENVINVKENQKQKMAIEKPVFKEEDEDLPQSPAPKPVEQPAPAPLKQEAPIEEPKTILNEEDIDDFFNNLDVNEYDRG